MSIPSRDLRHNSAAVMARVERGERVVSTPLPQQGLLDTSAVIDLGDLDPDSLPAEPLVCSITLVELFVGPLVAKTPAEQSARQLLLQQVESDVEALPFDAAAGRAFGSVAASLRASGRKPAARPYDVRTVTTA